MRNLDYKELKEKYPSVYKLLSNYIDKWKEENDYVLVTHLKVHGLPFAMQIGILKEFLYESFGISFMVIKEGVTIQYDDGKWFSNIVNHTMIKSTQYKCDNTVQERIGIREYNHILNHIFNQIELKINTVNYLNK